MSSIYKYGFSTQKKYIYKYGMQDLNGSSFVNKPKF